MYQEDEQIICLSNDGSVYVPPEPPERPESPEPPEPYIPTLKEVQVAKRTEIAAACEHAVYRGVSVTLADGTTEHYSLTEHDQLNLFGKQIQLSAGMEQIEYHADGQPCRYYPAADMQAIIQAAMWHVSYHTTYCNALNMWIAGEMDKDAVSAIFYGADVPEEYRSEVLNAYIAQIAAMAGEEDSDGTQATI